MAASRNQLIIGALLILTIAVGFGLRTYWNADQAMGESGNYTLSGNDPYYHKHAVDHITETWSTLEQDPMLDYPVGSVNPNPPLHQWTMAAGAQALEPVAGDMETATWWSVLYAPAVWGVLTIIPVFLIARMFAGDWAGLLAAFLVATAPEHMSRTNLGFSDHDAMVIFLAVSGFYFLLRSLQAVGDRRKDISGSELVGRFGQWFTGDRRASGSAILAGGFFGALALTWKGFPYVFGIVLAYAGLQFLINHWRGRDTARPFFATFTTLGVALLLGFPYYASLGLLNFWNPALFLFLALTTLGVYFVATRNYPSVLVVPGLLAVAGVFMAAMFFVVPSVAKSLLYRFVYFRQTSLYTTIAEAHPADFSSLAFAVNPIIFFMYLAGFGFLLYRVWTKNRPTDLFFTVWAGVDLFLAITAVRFISQSVPTIALLGAIATIWTLDLLNLPSLSEKHRKSGFRSITRSTGTAFLVSMLTLAAIAVLLMFLGYTMSAIVLAVALALFLINASLGLSTGSNFLYVVAVLFVGFLILLPGAALGIDAALPSGEEQRNVQQARQSALEDIGETGRDLGLEPETIQALQDAANNSRDAEQFRSNLDDIRLREGLEQDTTDKVFAAAEDEFGTISTYSKRLGAFGTSFLPGGWADTLNTLATYDTDEHPTERPGFLAWWDYGHWSIAVAKHPAVADNFQNGYKLAGHFITAQNETHAVQLMVAKHAEIMSEEDYTSLLEQHGLSEFDAERIYEGFTKRTYPFIQFSEDPDENLATSVAFAQDVEEATGKPVRYVAVDNRMLPLDDPSTRFIESSSIYYAPVTLADKDPQTFVEQSLVNMQTGQKVSDEQLRQIRRNPNSQVQLGQQLFYHDNFFESMFYRAFMGLPVNEPLQFQGQSRPQPFDLNNYPQYYRDPVMLRAQSDTVTGVALSNEVAPGFGLKHFRLIDANPSVRMLEYYPGAIVEGQVTLDGVPQEGVRVTVFDDAGDEVFNTNARYFRQTQRTAEDLNVPHDSVLTDANGTYRLVAPFSTDDGVTLRVTQEDPNARRPALMATETLEISREAANTRETFTQDIDISPATVTGTAFLDLNGNGTQDDDEDILSGVNVSIQGKNTTTDRNGQWTLEGLAPGRHTVEATKPGYRLATQSGEVQLVGGEVVEHNLSMSYEPVGVTGTVVDQSGEATEGINVRFTPAEGNRTGQENNQFSQVNGTLDLNLQPGVYEVGGNGTDFETNQTLEVISVNVTAGTGASVDEDGNLVIQPGAEGVEIQVEVAPES